ncbi:MAG: hypothetical protein ACP5HK_04000 [Acidilobus sp.]
MSAYRAQAKGTTKEARDVTYGVSRKDEEMLDWYVASLVGEGA